MKVSGGSVSSASPPPASHSPPLPVARYTPATLRLLAGTKSRVIADASEIIMSTAGLRGAGAGGGAAKNDLYVWHTRTGTSESGKCIL
jgi:hypothetical protein